MHQCPRDADRRKTAFVPTCMTALKLARAAGYPGCTVSARGDAPVQVQVELVGGRIVEDLRRLHKAYFAVGQYPSFFEGSSIWAPCLRPAASRTSRVWGKRVIRLPALACAWSTCMWITRVLHRARALSRFRRRTGRSRAFSADNQVLAGDDRLAQDGHISL